MRNFNTVGDPTTVPGPSGFGCGCLTACDDCFGGCCVVFRVGSIFTASGLGGRRPAGERTGFTSLRPAEIASFFRAAGTVFGLIVPDFAASDDGELKETGIIPGSNLKRREELLVEGDGLTGSGDGLGVTFNPGEQPDSLLAAPLTDGDCWGDTPVGGEGDCCGASVTSLTPISTVNYDPSKK